MGKKRNQDSEQGHSKLAPSAQECLRLGHDCTYKKELRRLQVELVKLQEWVRHKGLKVVVIFEGRDAAGKGGSIKRIAESLNPRICRVVALGTPTERETTQSYFQRYVAHLPAKAKSFCLIAAGTTGPASNTLWDFALTTNTWNSCIVGRSLSECWSASAS